MADLLLERVRPPGWLNPSGGRYTLVVLGGGPAGLVAAIGAAGLGAKVALVEARRLGGDCLNTGCVPSKALLRAGRAAAEIRKAAVFGMSSSLTVNFPRVMERLREERAAIAEDDAAERLRSLGVDVYFGTPSFSGPDRLRVAEKELQFFRAILATGARPLDLELPSDPRILSTDTLWDLQELPRHLLIVGGGPVGCEMAQAFARLGSEVSLVESQDRLLPREDPEAAACIAQALREDGVRLYLHHRLGDTCITETHIQCTPYPIHSTKDTSSSDVSRIHASHVLQCIGRRPNLEGLQLSVAQVRVEDQRLRLTPGLRTSNPRIYAAGDVCGGIALTHAADAMARIAIRNALFPGEQEFRPIAVPRAIYTEPELASVGLDAAATEKAGGMLLTSPFSQNHRARLDGDTQGFARLHLDSHGKILGGVVVGEGAGEAIAELALALQMGAHAGDLSATIHPYPTRSEIWRRLGDAAQRRRLTPLVGRVLRGYLRWRGGVG